MDSLPVREIGSTLDFVDEHDGGLVAVTKETGPMVEGALDEAWSSVEVVSVPS